MPRSRRALLKAAALTLGSGTIASTAGCLKGSSAGRSTPEQSPTPTRPAAGFDAATALDVTQWLPDPTTTPLRDGYGVRYFDIAAIRRHRPAIHENAYARLKSEMLRPVPARLVNRADVDATVAIDFLADLTYGSFDPAAVAERLTRSRGATATTTATDTPRTPTRTPWPDAERYRGFELYGTERVYAISETAVLAVAPMREADALAVAKAIIDTHAEETSQYPAGNAYVASLFDLVETPHALWCYPEAMDGSTERGFRADAITGELKAWRYGPDTTRLTFANTYVDAETAASGELSSFLDSNAGRFGPYEGLEVTVEGRLAWTAGTIATGQFDFLAPGGPADGVHTPN